MKENGPLAVLHYSIYNDKAPKPHTENFIHLASASFFSLFPCISSALCTFYFKLFKKKASDRVNTLSLPGLSTWTHLTCINQQESYQDLQLTQIMVILFGKITA